MMTKTAFDKVIRKASRSGYHFVCAVLPLRGHSLRAVYPARKIRWG
jgi:hypothetical protein